MPLFIDSSARLAGQSGSVICFYYLCIRFEYTEYLYPFAYSALLWMIRVRERIVELTL